MLILTLILHLLPDPLINQVCSTDWAYEVSFGDSDTNSTFTNQIVNTLCGG